MEMLQLREGYPTSLQGSHRQLKNCGATHDPCGIRSLHIPLQHQDLSSTCYDVGRTCVDDTDVCSCYALRMQH